MPTVLGLLAEKLIESGWLLAVIVTPLFFNVYSYRVFEPDKLTILRSLALVMVLAGVVRFLERSRVSNAVRTGTEAEPRLAHAWRTLLGTPILLPVVLYVSVYLLATATSVAPNLSIWGSYQRRQGAYSMLAYVTVFAFVLGLLRTREQLDRLINTMIFVSLPVALYGIVQHYGLDPVPWAGDVVTRVASTMGNFIFVAAYLIMIVPLTLVKLIEAVQALMEADQRPTAPFVAATGYSFILIAQVAAIVFTQSRGPWLGLLGGLFFFGLLRAFTKRDQRIALGVTLVALVSFASLVVINLPKTPLAFVRDIPYVGRLSRIFDTAPGTTGLVRILIWEGTVRLIGVHRPLWLPTNGADPLNPIRPLIGYGPECMHVAYNPFYPPDLAHVEAREASPDRAHNETFDTLVVSGALGLITHLLLWTSLFCFGLRWLGLIRDAHQRNAFLGLWLGTGVLAVVGFAVVDGTWRFSGVALPAGMMLGLFVYLVLYTMLWRGDEPQADERRRLLIIGLMAALIAHFVEIHFGIAITSTRTHFWVLAALLVIAGTRSFGSSYQRRLRPQRKVTSCKGKEGGRSLGHGRVLLAYSLIVAAILMTLAYVFIPIAPQAGPAERWAVVWIFSLTTLVAGAIAVAETASGGEAAGQISAWLSASLSYLVVAGLWLIFFALVKRAQVQPSHDISTVHSVYLLVVTVVALALSLVLARREVPKGATIARGVLSLAYPLLAVAAAWLIVVTNINVVRADVYYKQAWINFHKRGEYDQAIRLYERAIEYAPDQDFFYLFLGKALLEKGQTLPDGNQRDQLIDQARQVLERAQRLNPLNTDHAANLARVHKVWAERTPDQELRQERFRRSLEYYTQATRLSPNAAHLYTEWGKAYAAMGEFDEALEKYLYSRQLDEQFVETYLRLGDLYREHKMWDQTAEAYEKAVAVEPSSAESHSALGLVYANLGRSEEAIAQNKAVLEIAPNDFPTYQNLAILYRELGRLDEALAAARAMQRTAPADKKSRADDLVASLEARLARQPAPGP